MILDVSTSTSIFRPCDEAAIGTLTAMRIVHKQPSVGLPIKNLVVKQRKLCPKHRLGPLERRMP